MTILPAARPGKLSLDDEVQKHIHDWRDRDDYIVRHLLTHTSGVRDASGLVGWADPNESAGDYNDAIARILARQRGTNFPPGTEHQIQQRRLQPAGDYPQTRTGQSLHEFADANVFKPLGMTHTHVHDDLPMLVPNLSSGYTRNASRRSAAKVDGVVVGNSEMYSTVGDLLRRLENFETRASARWRCSPPCRNLRCSELKNALIGHGSRRGSISRLPALDDSGDDYGIERKVELFSNQHFEVAVLSNEDSVVAGDRVAVEIRTYSLTASLTSISQM
jgi:CubicO group peptidase (beta-lactamase class C family)